MSDTPDEPTSPKGPTDQEIIAPYLSLDALVAVVKSLADQTQAFNDKLDRVEQAETVTRNKGDSTRNMVWIVIGSLIFDLALSLGLGYTAWQASTAAGNAKTAIVTNCKAGNQARADQIKLWNFIFTISDGNDSQRADLTPEQQKAREVQLAAFRAFIGKTFAQRDCTVK